MSLTSIYYLAFISLVLVLYYSIGQRWKHFLLLAASFMFYYLVQRWYLGFLIFSILLNYSMALLWRKSRNRAWIFTGIVYNIAILAFFKYIPVLLFGNSIPVDTFWSRVILPIGISFYSFQAIGFLLDVYWSETSELPTISRFSLYMAFFPQLLSGPIARSQLFLPQIDKRKSFDYDNLVFGARLILWGLFKKLVIANNLSPYTDAIFNNHPMHSGLTLILATLAYAVQAYTDFSGYSDIAIGSARMFGYSLVENFREPYFAKSVTDFWRRWHISLSSWARDYVNTPLQFKLRSYGLRGILFAAFITFMVIGLWHGAHMRHFLFGLLQGIAISYEYITRSIRDRIWRLLPKRLGNVLANVLVFCFFSCCFILLRTSIPEAYAIISRFSLDPSGLFLGSKRLIVYSVTGIMIVWITELAKRESLFTEFLGNKKLVLRWAYYVSCSILILLIGSLNNENFIYFQF